MRGVVFTAVCLRRVCLSCCYMTRNQNGGKDYKRGGRNLWRYACHVVLG